MHFCDISGYSEKRVTSLFNQLLPQCSSHQFKNLHHCCRNTEDVHLKGNSFFFDKIIALINLKIFQAVADQNFLEDWGIGSVMGRKMVVGWAVDRHSSGASVCF